MQAFNFLNLFSGLLLLIAILTGIYLFHMLNRRLDTFKVQIYDSNKLIHISYKHVDTQLKELRTGLKDAHKGIERVMSLVEMSNDDRKVTLQNLHDTTVELAKSKFKAKHDKKVYNTQIKNKRSTDK